QRQPGVEAAGKPLDQARPQHQLMADGLGVGRGFLAGRQRESGSTHVADRLYRSLVGERTESVYQQVAGCDGRRAFSRARRLAIRQGVRSEAAAASLGMVVGFDAVPPTVLPLAALSRGG